MDVGIASRPSTFTRRTVMASALAGGMGVAAARLMKLRLPDPSLAASPSGWKAPLDQDAALVSQLLRRTALGAGAADLARAQRDGFQKTVDRLLSSPSAEPVPLEGADSASQSAPLRLAALQAWWIEWMLSSPTPFAERMTLFWHNHFTSDYQKVGLQSPYLYWQNLTWRRMSLTDFGSMLRQVTVDPAMLRYLDLGTSTGASPNENYSRELMELFTMGAGNYTEDDVRAAAKALAGWREPITAAMIDGRRKFAQAHATSPVAAAAGAEPQADESTTGIFVPRRAYSGDVTFLRKTGHLSTQDVLETILKQPSVAPFIVAKVLADYVTPTPSAGTVGRLAARFTASGYDMRSLMSDVLLSPEFADAGSYRSLVKSPTEFMVSAARALNTPVGAAAKLIAVSGQAMGQALFDPPDVGGWPINSAWISSSSMLARVNFVSALLEATPALPDASAAVATYLDGVVSPQTAKQIQSAGSAHDAWFAVLASPEFQLK